MLCCLCCLFINNKEIPKNSHLPGCGAFAHPIGSARNQIYQGKLFHYWYVLLPSSFHNLNLTLILTYSTNGLGIQFLDRLYNINTTNCTTILPHQAMISDVSLERNLAGISLKHFAFSSFKSIFIFWALVIWIIIDAIFKHFSDWVSVPFVGCVWPLSVYNFLRQLTCWKYSFHILFLIHQSRLSCVNHKSNAVH